MAIKRRSGGSHVDIANVRRRSGSSWVTPSNVYRRQGEAWVKVWPVNVPLSMTLSHTEIYGYSPSTGTIYTNSVIASPSGGTGSYTYSWARISGQATVFASASTSSVSFYSIFTSQGKRYATFRCTISDGVSSVYRDVYVEISCG